MNDNVSSITENTLEQTTLDWVESLGWQTAFGPDISPNLLVPDMARQTGSHGAGKHADREAGV